jgi:putative ABC transport system permease protein
MNAGRPVEQSSWPEEVWRDVRYALRTWRRGPGFALVAIATLAVAIGGATAVFSMCEAVLFRPLPYAESGRLIAVWDRHATDRKLAKIFASYADFETWRHDSRTIELAAAATWATGDQVLTGDGPARLALAIPASLDFFTLFGVPPQMGRGFESADLNRGCTVVLAARFWRSALAAPAGIVGRSLALDGRACTVVGVMPDRFSFYPAATDMWMLITPNREQLPRDRYQGVGVFARLRPGVTLERAAEELAALHRRAHAGDAHGTAFAPLVSPLQSEFTWLAGRNLRATLWVLFAAVAVVLLMASVNVANLLLGRSLERQRELAIRAAVGSGRWRLARQLLTEALLLSACATTAGLVLAEAVLAWVRVGAPIELPPGTRIALDGGVLLFAIAVAVATALAFGVVPAWRSSRADIHALLKAQSAGADRGRSTRARSLMIGIEMASAMVLLVGAGLLTQSIARLAAVPLGFNPDGLLTMSVRLPRTTYPQTAARAAFYRRLIDGIAALPGVDGAAMTTSLLRGGAITSLLVDGRPDPPPDAAPPDVSQYVVSVDYFRVMEIPLRAGRAFEPADREGAPAVSIVNEALARKYFPDENPIGRRIGTPNNAWSTIVGVVANTKHADVFQEMSRIDSPMIFRATMQEPSGDAAVVVRSQAPGSVGAAIQRLAAELDPSVPVADVQSMRDRMARDLAYPEFRAAVLTAFAAVALALAAVGLYAVLAQLVAQRTHEFGVRMALGARSLDIAALVGVQGGAPTLAGLTSGIAAALALERVLSSLLYGAGAADAIAIGAVASVLLLTAAIAIAVPAARAMRVDPLAALRSD